MSLYLNFYKMSPEGAQGLLEQGFVGRRTQTAEQIEAIGGTLHSWHLFANGDWDIAAIMEFPDDMDSATVVTRLTATAAGSWAKTRSMRLVTGEEADAIGGLEYTPPGDEA